MSSSRKTLTESIELELYPHQEIELRALDTHELIISVGGIGSGKTTSLVLWLLWLMQRGYTGQVHALFALTTTGLRSITRVMDKILDRIPAVRNRERTVSTRPPKEWVADWERRRVPTPPRQDRYENIRIWPCGLHLQLGTVHNRGYEQYRGSEWGSAALEEFALHGVSKDAFDFIEERVRCGDSGEAEEDDCRQVYGHRHPIILHSNPPEHPDHWSWEMFEALERRASELPGAVKREDGAEGYPNLIAGVGSAILIPSRTTDNVRLGKRYVENKLARLDSETAKRRLGGALTRSKAGRVYNGFSHFNEIDTFDYDPNRTLWVSLDFNKHASAATLHHPLKPGEYPSEYDRPGFQHFGTFGTFFHVGGLNTEQLCGMLLTGEAGNQSNMPEWFRGLLEHRTKIVFYGDATSNYERQAGNEWEIVDKICGDALRGRYSKDVPDKKNPLVSVSVMAFNSKACSGNGMRSYWMHPRNEELRKDFLTNVWDKTGKDIQKHGYRPGSSSKDYQRTHAADTVRYLVSRLFPMGAEVDRSRSPLPNMPFSRFTEPSM